MEKRNKILIGVLSAFILIFCIGVILDSSNNITEEGLDKNHLSTAEAGTTYSITINCSGVSNVIKIYGMDFIPQGGIQEFELEQRVYSLYGAQVGRFTSFEVTSSGVVSYDPVFEGSVLLGEGTSILTVIGHPIIINATDVDQDIALGYWPHINSFMGWTEAGTTRTYKLVVSGQYTYGLWTYFTSHFATFDILPTGVISYDNSHLGIIEGNGTNTLKPTGVFQNCQDGISKLP